MSATAAEFRKPVFNLPREYLGLAKVWMAKIAAEDRAAEAAMNLIGRAARAPLAQGKIARPEHLQDIAQRGKNEVPTAGRLRLEINRSNRHLYISDLRMSATKQEIPGWVKIEDVIIVYIVGIAVKRREFQPVHALLAVVSLHALARRHQRAFDISDASIRSDLIHLAAAVNQPPTGRFFVRVPEGAWSGRLQIFPDNSSALDVRTFISAGDLE